MLSFCVNPFPFPPTGSPALGRTGLPSNHLCMILRGKQTTLVTGVLASLVGIGMFRVMVEFRNLWKRDWLTFQVMAEKYCPYLTYEASDSLRRFHALRMPSGGPTTTSPVRYVKFPELRSMSTYLDRPPNWSCAGLVCMPSSDFLEETSTPTLGTTAST